MKKPKTSTLKHKLDKLWAEYIKKRAGGKCEKCGNTQYLNAHHIYSRSHFASRYDEENGVALCPSHHTFSNEFSAHKTPVEFTEWLYKTKGEAFMDSLKQVKNQAVHYEREWLESRIKYFEDRLEEFN